ncbi:signal recognition particle 19 kDa protein-like [Stylophora pistillata]|uniref:signal recognition particle 19 kDa protein-like n=1 Tax=Stylophora pistillata TaxID=50429 RepID=UPI000C03AC41|nr:signal recognition particle 19 kDa protein-like [Stylophora pistillata]
MAHLSTDPASKDRWIVVYPAYLNSRRTVQQGRRVPKEKAADNPTVYEIRDVCQSQGLNCEVEVNIVNLFILFLTCKVLLSLFFEVLDISETK